ncbi:MAG: hprK [Gemmatimonadetes bacterium]|nr:hprK [Gemmatimonadota bacterium]
MNAPKTVSFSLLHDDALVVHVDEALLPVVSRWLPLHAVPATREITCGAAIDVTYGPGATADVTRTEPPFIVFGGVRVLQDPGDVLALVASSRARGWIELGARRARLELPRGVNDADSDERTAWDIYSMLTLSAAFLLGRVGGALVHAGCVVDPEGRAWLLIGDTHAGKTTTCVSLVAEGWRFLADDQVVLRPSDGAVEVQGWPRHAHLDEGWTDSVVSGTRAAVDLRARYGDRWLRQAPLGGLLLPTVHPHEPTSATSVDAATSFTALVRQSPWLIADRGAAPAVMALLRDAAARPAYALTLGSDSYARGAVLASRLDPARKAADARATHASSR